MFKKILTSILVVIGLIFLPFAFVFATIYFMLRPEKATEWSQGRKVKPTESSNTGLH